MGDAELVRKHLEFLPVEGGNLVAYRLKENANGDAWEDIIVALNSRKEPAKLVVPEGKYTVVCKDGFINEKDWVHFMVRKCWFRHNLHLLFISKNKYLCLQ